MRPVFFVKYYDKASTILGGEHISAALQACGRQARVIHASELPDVRDAIAIFLKTSRLDHLWRARRRGNVLVQDLQDTLVFKKHIKNRFLYDGFIFRNPAQLEDYQVPGRANIFSHHHWDDRYRFNEANGELKIAYFGDLRSLRYWNAIPGVEFISEDWFGRAADFNCHLSIREPGREFRYKPNTKVSTAAACNANIITTRDVSAFSLLGEDYPYYTEPDLESIMRTIEHARRTFRTPVWEGGLEMMGHAREETTIQKEIDRYLELFQLLGA